MTIQVSVPDQVVVEVLLLPALLLPACRLHQSLPASVPFPVATSGYSSYSRVTTSHLCTQTVQHFLVERCPAMPCHAVPCRAMPCHAVPCRAMPGVFLGAVCCVRSFLSVGMAGAWLVLPPLEAASQHCYGSGDLGTATHPIMISRSWTLPGNRKLQPAWPSGWAAA
jgi:hypothetical protein